MTYSDSPSPHCIDGETLAAWSSGSLRTAEAAAVEEHLSNCERCHAMLATFVRIEPQPAAAESIWRRWHLQWLVPLATAATVAAIWVAIPTEQREAVLSDQREAETASTHLQSSAANVPAAKPDAFVQAPLESLRVDESKPTARLDDARKMELERRRRLVGQEPTPQKRNEADVEADRKAAATVGAAADALAKAPPPPAAPQAAPPVLEERAANRSAELARDTASFRVATPQQESISALILSPDPTYRWRIRGGRQVDRSVTAGTDWQPIAIPASERLTAGHSSSTMVAWLVGQAGAVYVTADGSRFEKVPFIEPIDLVGVIAIDDRQATVTTADGRVFQTMDRGLTWARVP